VRAQLDRAGQLLSVEVERASGLAFLDDEALAAFRAASPFPNPPEQLIESSDGRIHFDLGLKLFPPTEPAAPH
jgi:TonB family protein